MSESIYEYLVSLMLQRKVKAEEIKKVLAEKGLKSSQSAVDNCIEVISMNYPLYECDERGFYKILTDEDLEAYRNELRNNQKA